jgi:hypothetical protein
MESVTGLSANDLPERLEDRNLSFAHGWRRYKVRWLHTWYPAQLNEDTEV